MLMLVFNYFKLDFEEKSRIKVACNVVRVKSRSVSGKLQGIDRNILVFFCHSAADIKTIKHNISILNQISFDTRSIIICN